MINADDYKKIMSFANKMKHESPGLSNLYYIRKYDLDGNLIDTYYGMNHFTDYGFNKYCTSSTAFPTNLYVGRGTSETYRRDSCIIEDLVTPNAAIIQDRTVDTNYPLYYSQGSDADTSYITCMCKFLTAYVDYTVEAARITEYGLGENAYALWTHSRVYDSEGHRVYISKTFNEKLVFDIFLCMSYTVGMINSVWNSGACIAITKMDKFINSSYRMYEDKVYSYKRNGVRYERSKQNSSTDISSEASQIGARECLRATVVNSFEIYNQTGDNNGYISGLCQYTPGWVVLQPLQLDQGDPFDTLVEPKNYAFSDILGTTLSDTFGNIDNVPFTQADIRHVYLYNMTSGQYDNEVSFVNDINHEYCESSFSPNLSTDIWYTKNDVRTKMYIYMNADPSTSITGFNNPGLETLYATNEYWNNWTFIPNPSSIPAEYRHCKYWITRENVTLNPIRESSMFCLKPSCGDAENTGYTGMFRTTTSMFDGSKWGYSVQGNTVYYPNTKTSYTISELGTSLDTLNRTFHVGYDKWLVSFGDNNIQYYLTQVDGGIHQTRAITIDTSSSGMGSTPSGSFSERTYKTDTGNGIICVQWVYNGNNSNYPNNKSLIIDLRNLNSFVDDMSPYHTYMTTAMCCAIYNTYKVAYILKNELNKVYVKDFSTNTTVSYMLPTGYSTTNALNPLMFGYKNYIWVNNLTKSYFINTDTDTEFTECQNPLTKFNINDDYPYLRFTYCDECLIVYRCIEPKYWKSYAFYIRYDQPLIVNRDMTIIGSRDNDSNMRDSVSYQLKYVAIKRDSLDDTIIAKTLVLTISSGYYFNATTTGDRIEVFDFGRFLKDADITSYHDQTSGSLYPAIPYGEFMLLYNRKVPLEYFLRHRITGYTKSVSAIANIKHVEGQTFGTYFTNYLPSTFDGIVPGTHL